MANTEGIIACSSIIEHREPEDRPDSTSSDEGLSSRQIEAIQSSWGLVEASIDLQTVGIILFKRLMQ